MGDKANVLVDTGHPAPGTNIEFIVASLLRLGRLGGLHFNSRFYADDDLLVGAADPYQLFRIMNEIVSAEAHQRRSGVAFMLDQCHNVEEKVPAESRSVIKVQEATAKALLVDREALRSAQAEGDVLKANGVLIDAFSTDVRSVLAERREDRPLSRAVPGSRQWHQGAATLRRQYRGQVGTRDMPAKVRAVCTRTGGPAFEGRTPRQVVLDSRHIGSCRRKAKALFTDDGVALGAGVQ